VREVIGSTLSGGGPESELVRWTLVGVLELSIVLFAGVCLMVFALAWRFFRLLWKSGKQFERRVEQKGVQATPSFLRFLRGDEDQLVSLGDESDRRN
jgi:membrane protein implicated in regulation of membrane protease activity